LSPPFFNGRSVRQFLATVVSNYPLSHDLHKLTFTWDTSAVAPAPGQFFTVRISDSTVPLLRRPFAVSDFRKDEGVASAIYQRRGRGTEILAGRREGAHLDVIGPLGNAFPNPGGAGKCILAAGGIGLGPILYLARRALHGSSGMTFVFGCRGKDNLPEGPELDGLAAAVCTDDGSRGFAGTVVEYLESLDAPALAGATLYACGPMAMLKGCHELAEKRGLDCFVSVEQVMACGVGACMGCVVKVNDDPGYARVCTEGPVFSSRRIRWT
jgi:dihydroorotate dehydrogenase electron transfer subunit